MNVILAIHGSMRWALLAVCVLCVGRFAYGWLAAARYKPFDRILMSSLTGLLDLNALLGLMVMFTPGSSARDRGIHATIMIVALLVAHSSAAWRKSEDAGRKFRNNLLVILAILALLSAGVLQLRGGWMF